MDKLELIRLVILVMLMGVLTTVIFLATSSTVLEGIRNVNRLGIENSGFVSFILVIAALAGLLIELSKIRD